MPIPINLKDFKIYAKTKQHHKCSKRYNQNPESPFEFNYEVAIMLLNNFPPNSMYNDIQNNFINEMTLRQFIKMKGKLGGDNNQAYEIATLDFNDFVCFKEMPSFNIIKQLYINQLPNKNEGQLCNKSTDSIIDPSEKTDNSSILKKRKNEKTDNSSIIKKRKEKECNILNKLNITKEEAYKIRSQNNTSLGIFFYKNKNN